MRTEKANCGGIIKPQKGTPNMKTLNLIANTTAQERVKEYLEANASDVLADKINNGTPIEKDGKTLTNKKTLDGFMKYATEEARKIAEKGASSACIEDSVVFGWAIHYFEEDSIVGTLYNEDGTEYKKPIEKKEKKTKTKKETPDIKENADTSKPDTKEKETKTIPEKEPQKPNSDSAQSQMSLFDLLGV